jgi:hypothetical protein
LTPLPCQAGSGQTVTLLDTGMVVTAEGTIGARPGKVNIIPYADLFDPSTGNDALTGSMTIPRVLHTATLLQNGQVLAAGGETQNAHRGDRDRRPLSARN